MLYRYVREWIPYALLRDTDAFGIRELDLAAPPARFGLDQRLVSDEIAIGVDEQNVERLLTPCELAAGLPAGDNWHALSKRTLDRLDAWFLVCEDPQRRLDAQAGRDPWPSGEPRAAHSRKSRSGPRADRRRGRSREDHRSGPADQERPRERTRASQPRPSPVGTRLAGRLVGSDGAERPVEAEEVGEIVRTLLRSTIRRQASGSVPIDSLREREGVWIRDLRTPSDADRKARLRRAVFPLAVAVLT